MASRSIDDLDPSFRLKAKRFEIICADAGVDLLIYCTLRSFDEQAILYRQSRTLARIKEKARELSDVHGRSDLAKILLDVGPQSGPHVTNAAPGQSLHNYGLALDGTLLVGGKPLWHDTEGGGAAESEHDERMWQIYGELADMAGMEWAGHWIGFREYPHCQQSGARWQDLITRRAA